MKNSLAFRVIYKDTDAEGVVYYANYLGWFEAGRTELIRDLGISLIELKEKEKVVFAVKDVHCEYFKPAVYDDEIIVETEISEVKPARIVFLQKVIRKKDAEPLTHAKITLVPLNLQNFKPVGIPAELRSKLTKK